MKCRLVVPQYPITQKIRESVFFVVGGLGAGGWGGEEESETAFVTVIN